MSKINNRSDEPQYTKLLEKRILAHADDIRTIYFIIDSLSDQIAKLEEKSK